MRRHLDDGKFMPSEWLIGAANAAVTADHSDGSDEHGTDDVEDIRLCRTRAMEIRKQAVALAASGFVQDPDVLDTWFSSTPLAAFDARLAGEDAGADVLLSDQRARHEPRHHHALGRPHGDRGAVQPRRGAVPSGLHHRSCSTASARPCRKSKGNGVDPLDIIDRYGADALRFLMVSIATETQDGRLPVANVCPHCDTLVPVKQEHMYMRTRKLDVPQLQEAVSARRAVADRGSRTEDRQASVGAVRDGPQLRQQDLERGPLHADESGRLHAATRRRRRIAGRGSLDFEPAGDDHGRDHGATGRLPLRRSGPDALRFRLVGVLRLVCRDEQESAASSRG